MLSSCFMSRSFNGTGVPNSRSLSTGLGGVVGFFLWIHCATVSAQSQQSVAPPALQTTTQIAPQYAAQASPPPPAQADLLQISLEDLMNIKVTSVSKTEQKMSRAAAAIFVITREDINRSGARRIPDLLRMVPGLDVSQINDNTWSVSSRGFNQQFTNKLLVLIDGRAVYSPLLGGVNWDTQDVPLDDIDRIEVIRGPGAAIWGANAVNGVINIVTKSASETKGGLITAGGGTEGQAQSTAQYGGTFHGATSYRIFTKYLNQGSLPGLDGGSGSDTWHLLHGGFRTDTQISKKDSLTVQGDLYTGAEGAGIIHIFSVDPPVIGNEDVITSLSGGNILGRWNHTFSNGSDTSLQFYFDNYKRDGPESNEERNTIDFDFNHHFAWGSRQDVVWGVGYRRTWDHVIGTIDQDFNSPDTSLELFNFFVQDPITLDPDRLFLTIGTKLENGYFTSYGLEPSVRLAWTPENWLTLWSAVSRAERSPAGTLNWWWDLRSFPIPEGRAHRWKRYYSAIRKFCPSTSSPMRRDSARSQTSIFPLMCRRFSIATII
jgi:iron complex outermembrane receptor protein